MRDKDVIDFLARAVKLGLEALPDTDEEQKKVKEVRTQLNGALEVYEVFKNATKTD